MKSSKNTRFVLVIIRAFKEFALGLWGKTLLVWDYFLENLIAVDQLANTILLGKADETLSSRAYRTERKGRIFGRIFRPIIDCLLFFQKDHCYWAYMAEVEKRQLPDDFSKR